MEYALLVYGDESRILAQAPEAVERHAEATAIFVKEVTDRGVLRGGAPLRPTTVATTVLGDDTLHVPQHGSRQKLPVGWKG